MLVNYNTFSYLSITFIRIIQLRRLNLLCAFNRLVFSVFVSVPLVKGTKSRTSFLQRPQKPLWRLLCCSLTSLVVELMGSFCYCLQTAKKGTNCPSLPCLCQTLPACPRGVSIFTFRLLTGFLPSL